MRSWLLHLCIASMLFKAIKSEDDIALTLKSQTKSMIKSIDKLHTAIDHIKCEAPSESLIRSFRDTLNLESRIIQLEKTIEDLRGQVAQAQAEQRKRSQVFFSVVSKKRFHCYGCMISFETVQADSHNAFHRDTFRCPESGHYFLQFHALAESGSEAKVEILMNGVEIMHLYDRDIGGYNQRYAMLGQSVIQKLNAGDEIAVRLHAGALKGGGDTTFTSFLGFKMSAENGSKNEI